MNHSVVKWLRSHWLDGLIVLGLLALTFFVRWNTLQRIENGGDPLDNWFFVKQWHYNDDSFSGYLNHHNARVGIHWLTWVCQKLLGTHPTVYFVPPLLASHVCSVLTYLLGRAAYSRSVGVAATLLLLEFNPFIFASSQLRPGIFEAMYVLGATLCAVEHIRRPPAARPSWLLAAAGSFAFLAYLAKVPTLFCSVGIAFSVFAYGGGLRALAIYCAPIALGIGLETAAYSLFTEYSHRVAVIMNAHARNPPNPHNFWYLFRRFSSANDSWKVLYYFFFAAGLNTLVGKRPAAQKAIVWAASSYLFLITFGVRRIDPIGLWVPMRDRYLTAVAPLATVVNASLLIEVARALGRSLVQASRRAPKVQAWAEVARQPAMGCVLGLATFLLLWKVWPDPEKKRPHAVEETKRAYELITDAYRRDLPIVARVTRRATKRRPWQQVRALHWAGKGFVADDALLDENGHLPNFSYRKSVASLNSKYSFMPTSAGSADDVRKLRKRKKHCALWLSVKGQNVRTSNQGNAMPKDCPSDRNITEESQ